MIVRHRGEVVFWFKEGVNDKPPSIPLESVLLFEKDKHRYFAYINRDGVYFIDSLGDISNVESNVENAYDLGELHDFQLNAFCYLATHKDILKSCLHKMGFITNISRSLFW